jgi:hypothetical protein
MPLLMGTTAVPPRAVSGKPWRADVSDPPVRLRLVGLARGALGQEHARTYGRKQLTANERRPWLRTMSIWWSACMRTPCAMPSRSSLSGYPWPGPAAARTVFASCSGHPGTRVSEQHRQAVKSALVRRWVRLCVAGNGKEWNRGCLHQTKSSIISLRCTCLALPATRWLDDPRERAVLAYIDSSIGNTVDSRQYSQV